MSQYEFLRFLREHPDSRVADLATEFAIGVGATSKGVDRLEKRGWVVRQADPADRRSHLLALTEEGARLLARAEDTFRPPPVRRPPRRQAPRRRARRRCGSG
ncbi:MarR family transcriptional regulator [Streptomyces hundungensis]|uniref:MarR family transcriptional regulator n=1 Tax=Streptomyces hundungensis TaxID=1077946 RepID=UPI000EA87DF0